MPAITVVFDDTCELCRRCHQWLARQDSMVPLRFLAASSPEAIAWLGAYVPIGQELVVVDHRGAAWIGPDAFIAVLSVLRRYTTLARRLQQPMLRPVARQAFHAVSIGRGTVSAVLMGLDEGTAAGDVAARLTPSDGSTSCAEGSCSLPDRWT
ncbi:MAG: DCC1-like thiol-disulfide oxidoreductase family protein [Acidimicrobiales bacterium]